MGDTDGEFVLLLVRLLPKLLRLLVLIQSKTGWHGFSGDGLETKSKKGIGKNAKGYSLIKRC